MVFAPAIHLNDQEGRSCAVLEDNMRRFSLLLYHADDIGTVFDFDVQRILYSTRAESGTLLRRRVGTRLAHVILLYEECSQHYPPFVDLVALARRYAPREDNAERCYDLTITAPVRTGLQFAVLQCAGREKVHWFVENMNLTYPASFAEHGAKKTSPRWAHDNLQSDVREEISALIRSAWLGRHFRRAPLIHQIDHAGQMHAPQRRHGLCQGARTRVMHGYNRYYANTGQFLRIIRN